MYNKAIYVVDYDSPCGKLVLGGMDGKLCLCDWKSASHSEYIIRRLCRILGADLKEGKFETAECAAMQLDEYFAGMRKDFDIPLLFAGTDFQKKIWHKLMEIPYGTTVSYSEMAHRIGKPTAVRAVAAANGANAISIFVPCHRVIGSNGTLTGYAGGLESKKFLLNLEQSY